MVGPEQMQRWILAIGVRAIEREKRFFARVRLAVRFLRLWGEYGKSR
jgi:hypothetical protein